MTIEGWGAVVVVAIGATQTLLLAIIALRGRRRTTRHSVVTTDTDDAPGGPLHRAGPRAQPPP